VAGFTPPTRLISVSIASPGKVQQQNPDAEKSRKENTSLDSELVVSGRTTVIARKRVSRKSELKGIL
jgi:hypothetical protein